MLANNNHSVIDKLAKNTVRANKRQFLILFLTILLSAFMLFSVFTIGLTYLDLSRLQNTRLYGSEYDIAIMNGFTEDQKESLVHYFGVKSVGVLAYCGNVKSSDSDRSVSAGFLWGDETYWENQKAPAITEMNGHYPQTRNELLATEEVLEACGKNTLSVGDRLSLTYEDNAGIHTTDFVINGIWKGYGGDQASFYVSKDFYEQTGYNLESDGILQLKFKSNYITRKTIEKLRESLRLSSTQIFQASEYIEKSLAILFAVLGLCLMICLSAYLLIYNILYLSVSGKIRYYGLLQTLGMTKKQLIRLIRKQILLVGVTGIIAGILLGISVSLILVPYAVKILGISMGNTGLYFYPEVLAFSIVATAIAIVCGVRKPIRIAADVTPVEAVKYRGTVVVPHAKKKKQGNLYWRMAKDQLKKKTGNLYWHMATDQLKNNKKRTMVVFLSLAMSLIVFFCLTTLIDSQGKRTVYPNYWDADFIVHNATQTTEDITSLQSAIDDAFLADIQGAEGVAEVHAVKGIPVIFPYEENGFSDFWIKGYTEMKPYLTYSDVVSEYQRNPEKYYGMIKGIDEAEFDYLNKSLGSIIDKQEFLSGRTAVLQYAGFEIPVEWIGNNISFSIPTGHPVTHAPAGRGNSFAVSHSIEDQKQEITIGAISYGDYYGASVNVGANLIVSENYLESLTSKPYILSLNIKYKRSYDTETEEEIKNIIQANPCHNELLFVSRYDDMKTIQDSQSGMFEIGTVISLLLLLVGMLNYVNTMANSMQNRKLTFSIMESVGMSKKQIKRLLAHEGILYAGGSAFITLTIGTGVTWCIFQSMNYMKIPFTIPVFPLLCALFFVMILCILTPIVTYKKTVRNRSITERLREYE